ncbi:MAG: ABC transporter ATP-binding protein [Chthoniobacteraceae bacterium]
MSAYVDMSQITKAYPKPGGGQQIVVSDFNLKIDKGEFVSVIGHSGCGKSTQLMMLAGLTKISSGVIVIGGKEIVGAGPDRGIVFQSPSLLPWMSAKANVMLGINQVFFTASKREREQIAEYYLSLVGLADSMDRFPGELSQGMCQRVGIARAFALKPKMLLLDEPFGMLDSLTRYELQQVLLDLWAREKITAMMVTHDVDEALYLSDRIVMMTNGPEATIGDILPVRFSRPRDRRSVMEHPEYYKLRENLIEFLEVRAYQRQPAPSSDEPAVAPQAPVASH